MKYAINIKVDFIKEEGGTTAYCPALDLATCGDTVEDARINFEEALSVFFEECIKHDTLNEVLESHGWKKRTVSSRSQWHPPVVLQDSLPVEIPAAT